MTLDVGLTHTIETLILPPGGLILLLVLALTLGRAVLGRLFALLVVAALYLASTPFAASHLAAGLETYPALTATQMTQTGAQAILMLGGGRYSAAPEYGGDTVNAITLERARYAAVLQRRTGLPLIVSGGAPMSDQAPESHLARQVLENEFGVKVAAVEDRSLNTRENARLSAPLLKGMDIHRVLLVTHAWHMARAVQSFQGLGIELVPAPTGFIHKQGAPPQWRDWLPGAQALRETYLCLHEYLGALWYRLS
jgi:uncharacterized SAM-binding protein YcdF (DUF218 family)